MDLATLSRAYDRSAAGYDQQFRALQQEKYRAAAALLVPWLLGPTPGLPEGARVLDAGAGTGLFAEWLCAGDEPLAQVRALLRAPLERGRLVALDASRAMVRKALPRRASAVVADLAQPPLRPGAFALVLAFTSVLERVPQALGALGALCAPGGALCVSFLARESPTAPAVAAASGLGYLAGVRAGQDQLFLLARGAEVTVLERDR